MRVFGFDLLPYPERLDHLKADGELPYPLPRRHFQPALAVQAYRERQIERFAAEVLPDLRRHDVTRVLAA